MSNKQDWFQKKWETETIEKIKSKRLEKQKLLKSRGAVNNYEKDFDTLWVGDVGEWTFGVFLNEVLKIRRGQDFSYLPTDTDFDSIDFVVGKRNIDVKTISRNVDPEDNYGCDIVERQFKKIMATDFPVDTLVFASHNLKTHTTTLLGWLTKKEFEEIAVFQPKGTVLNKFTISTSQYEVQISKLHWFDDSFLASQKEEKTAPRGKCYLDGCENESKPDIGGGCFCSKEHHEEWANKNYPPKRSFSGFKFTPKPRVSTGAPGAPKDEDIIQAAREIFADDGVATGKPTLPQQSRLTESESGIGDTPQSAETNQGTPQKLI